MEQDEKDRARSVRRHHLERVKAARLKYIVMEWRTPENKAYYAGKMAHTAAPCSCWMCGNPRKHQKEKLTRQEVLHRLLEKEYASRDRFDAWEDLDWANREYTWQA